MQRTEPNIKELPAISITSGNTKLGKVANISLPPGVSCGSVSCSDKCYARKAWKMYPNVRKAWQRNWDSYTKDAMGYFEAVAQFCINNIVDRFRWHVAGDIPNQGYYDGMCLVANCLEDTQFLCFTKNERIISRPRPSNLRLVLSAWPKKVPATPWAQSRLCEHRDAPDLRSAARLQFRSWITEFEPQAPIAFVDLDEPVTDMEKGYQDVIEETIRPQAVQCGSHCDQCFMCWYAEPGMYILLKEH